MHCNTCNLKKIIEKAKLFLDDLIHEKNSNLLDPHVIHQSQVLDDLILECVNCKKRFFDKDKISLDNVLGIHSTFYYYGMDHLFIDMCEYIKKGIDHNEYINVSMEKDLFNELLDAFEPVGISRDQIHFCSVKELINSHKNDGVDGLKRKTENLTQDVLEKGYNGIRWIGQPTYAIQETSKEDFLNWEEDLSEALEDTKASIICIYDVYDYMHDKKFIDDEVIEKSKHTHSHVLNRSVLKLL